MSDKKTNECVETELVADSEILPNQEKDKQKQKELDKLEQSDPAIREKINNYMELITERMGKDIKATPNYVASHFTKLNQATLERYIKSGFVSTMRKEDNRQDRDISYDNKKLDAVAIATALYLCDSEKNLPAESLKVVQNMVLGEFSRTQNSPSFLKNLVARIKRIF